MRPLSLGLRNNFNPGSEEGLDVMTRIFLFVVATIPLHFHSFLFTTT